MCPLKTSKSTYFCALGPDPFRGGNGSIASIARIGAVVKKVRNFIEMLRGHRVENRCGMAGGGVL